MNLKNIYVATILVAIAVVSTKAQPWLYGYKPDFKSTDEELSFQQQKEAFDTYWQNKKITKGKGYKPFRRWAYIIEPRIINSDEGLNSLELWNSILAKSVNPPTDTITWKFVGPDKTPYVIETNSLSGNGRLNCVAFHPTDSNIIYVGAPSGGIWISLDAGISWSTTTDMLDAIGISDIVVSHSNPSTIYIATGDGDASDTYALGILKSTDGGLNWVPTGLSMDVTSKNYFRRIIMNPNNANIMFATSSKGIYKTTDGWQTYTLVITGNFKDLEFKPGNPNYIYATSYNFTGLAKIYRSTDGGNTFNVTGTGLTLDNKVERIELAVTKANGNIIYALASSAENSGFYALYKSSNSGDSWSLVMDDQSENLLGWTADGSDIGGQGWYDLSLAVSPENANTIFVGGVNVWKSVNGGISWSISGLWYYSQQTDYVHADQHMFAFSPYSNTLYAANDGGLYRTYDLGKNWKDISNDLQILQVYKLGTSKTNTGKTICGNQDNGTFLLNNNEWFQVLGGDGMECIIDPVNEDIIYGSSQNGSIYKSTDGGLNFSSIVPEAGLIGSWVTPYQISKQNPSTIFAAYNDVYRSTDAGGNWEKISTNLSSTSFNSLAVAPSNDNYIYVATLSNILKTQNGGNTWTDITNGLPSLGISSIVVSPNDPNKIWVSFSGYTINRKVYFSTNGGITWSNYSTGLPNLPVNNLILRYNSNQEIYAATDNGVYYRNADMDEWIDYSNGLPKVIVNELEILEPENIIRAATYGRGIWEAELPPAIPPKAAFTANITKGCTNAPFKLIYTGLAEFDSLVWVHNSGAVIDNSENNDTVIISFGTTGKKTIQLKHYRNDTLSSEIKYEYIDVSSTLNVNLSPDKFFVCDTTELKVFLPDGYDFEWQPLTNVDTIINNMVVIKPTEDIVYSATFHHGTCSTVNELPVKFMPDNACSAFVLTVGTYGIFSNNCATKETGEPVPGPGTGEFSGCVSQDGWCASEDRIDNSLWFKIVVPDSGKIRIRARGFDSQIALYKANSCTDLFDEKYTLLAANDDISSTNYDSEISLLTNLVAGDTLLLQVDGSYGGVSGEFYIDIAEKISPVNEQFMETLSNVVIYPNPAAEKIMVEMIVPKMDIVTIDFISETGKIELSKTTDSKVSYFEQEFDVAKLHGFYIIRIKTGNSFVFKKVVIK